MKHLYAILLTVLWAGIAPADVIIGAIEDVNTRREPRSVHDIPQSNVVNFAWHEVQYYKFDLSDISDLEDVTSMTLRLYEVGNSWGNRAETLDLYFTNDHSWSETSDYSDVPLHNGQLIDQVSNPARSSGWITWDLSGYDLENNAVDDTLTLIVENNDTSASWVMTSFANSEYADAQYRPQLVLEGDLSLVPEPGSLACLAMGLTLLIRRKR